MNHLEFAGTEQAELASVLPLVNNQGKAGFLHYCSAGLASLWQPPEHDSAPCNLAALAEKAAADSPKSVELGELCALSPPRRWAA